MKVYRAFLICDDEKYKKCQGCVDYSLFKYDSEKDLWIALYGFTNKKKLFKAFKKIHSDILTYDTIELDDEEYDKMWIRHKLSRIEKFNLEIGIEKEIEMPMTFMENLYSVDYKEECFYEDCASYAKIDYRIFNTLYQGYLEDIKYVMDYVSSYSSPDEIDFMHYNNSYSSIHRVINELGLFVSTYKDFLNIDGITLYLLERRKK